MKYTSNRFPIVFYYIVLRERRDDVLTLVIPIEFGSEAAWEFESRRNVVHRLLQSIVHWIRHWSDAGSALQFGYKEVQWSVSSHDGAMARFTVEYINWIDMIAKKSVYFTGSRTWTVAGHPAEHETLTQLQKKSLHYQAKNIQKAKFLKNKAIQCILKIPFYWYTWCHPELLTFEETRNNRLNTFVPLYTLAVRSMMPQNIDFKSNANMNAWRKSAGALTAFPKFVVFRLVHRLFLYVLGCRLCPNFKIFLNILNLCKHFNRV